jgi:hypothetical protein
MSHAFASKSIAPGAGYFKGLSMPKTIQGYSCDDTLCLDRVLKKWISVNREITGLWRPDKDVPWWDNERASLSIFAGAVWRAGGVCFEEYCDEKRGLSRRTGRLMRPYAGRVDLYFEFEGRRFIAEAKRMWSGFSSPGAKPMVRADKKLDKARADIRKVKPRRGQRRLAILFAIPYFRVRVKNSLDERVEKWIAELEKLKCSARAWVFPSEARNIKAPDGFYHPGAAILIDEV